MIMCVKQRNTNVTEFQYINSLFFSSLFRFLGQLLVVAPGIIQPPM